VENEEEAEADWEDQGEEVGPKKSGKALGKRLEINDESFKRFARRHPKSFRNSRFQK